MLNSKLFSAALCTLLAAQVDAQIVLKVSVQPISVADDAGANPTTVTINETYLDKIFAQAGIDFSVLPTVTLNRTIRQNIDSPGEVSVLSGSGGAAVNHPDSKVINLYFVNSFSGGEHGLALEPGNVATVDDDIAATDPSLIAHEVGHAMGLSHRPAENKNLMFPSSVGIIGIGDVAPDGAAFFVLDATQQTHLQASTRVTHISYTPVPEPAETTLAVGAGLGIFFALRRYLRSRSLPAVKA